MTKLGQRLRQSYHLVKLNTVPNSELDRGPNMPGSKLLECSEVLVLNQSGLIFMLNDYIYNKNNKHLNLSKFPQTLPKDSKTDHTNT